MTCGQWGERVPGLDFKRVNGGLLVQDRDTGMVGAEELRVVTQRQPTEQELRDALFCWKVAKFVKSMLSSMPKQYDHRYWRGPDEPRVLRENRRY